jgi:predicted nucleotidyltransferase
MILFGSLARGRAKPESDIDLFLAVKGLSSGYSERMETIRRILSTEAIDKLTIYLWSSRGVYPNLEVIAVTPEEASLTHPFYLDMAEKSVIIYDRAGFTENKLREVRERLIRNIGAEKVALPTGEWYWLLTPKLEEARSLEL